MAVVIGNKNVNFDYKFVSVGDLAVTTETNKNTGRSRVSKVKVQDEDLQPTDRFWTSLYARYGFNSAFFKYFDHAEVFTRISEREKNDRMRVCVERADDGTNRLLAVSAPTKAFVDYDAIYDLVNRYGGENVSYHDGIVESVHTPRNGANAITVGADDFKHRFVLSTPIDGYGDPNVYLSMLRLLCSNGLVGYGKAFRSQVSLGKGADDSRPSIVRVLEGFGNEEGFAALRQRIESAQKSWASVHETQGLYKLLLKLVVGNTVDNDSQNRLSPGLRKWYEKSNAMVYGTLRGADETWQMPITRAFEGMTGSPTLLYGLANPDSLSVKRQRTLPVNCTVYDAINFATEVATHHADPSANRRLQAWVGELISGEFDMEGTRDKFTEFKDFHLTAKLGAGVTGYDAPTAILN